MRMYASLLLLAFPFGCDDKKLPPQGQILLYFDTDAPVPAAPGKTLGTNDPPALFDTVIVDIVAPAGSPQCMACTRTFALDVDRLRDKKASIGIPLRPATAGYRARLRLFPSRWVRSCWPSPDAGACEPSSDPTIAQPHPRATIDVTVELPPIAAEGIVERTVVLSVNRVGQPVALMEGAEYFPGRPVSSLVGKWPPAKRIVECTGTRRPNEACVPGGAFWMGDPRLLDHAEEPRLVVVSPFFVRKAEVTTGEFRPLAGSGVVRAEQLSHCTLTNSPGAKEDRPMNCLTRTAARAFCLNDGADLPTEAQFEWLAGGVRGGTYVWGDEDPTCTDAIWGRGGGLSPSGSPCARVPGDPEPVDSGLRDRLALEGGEVVDISGNVCEWTRDSWNSQHEGCWSSPRVYVDPLCEQPTTNFQMGLIATFRGGSWMSTTIAAAARRNGGGWGPIDGSTISVELGFRCVRPAGQ